MLSIDKIFDILRDSRRRRKAKARSYRPDERILHAGFYFMLSVRTGEHGEEYVLVSRMPRELVVRGGIREVLEGMKKELDEALSKVPEDM